MAFEGNSASISKRLVCSYLFDWVVILVVAAIGGALYKLTGNQHAFALDDRNISYPLLSDTVSITVVGIVACGVPAVVIMLLCLLIPSSSIAASNTEKERPNPWQRRLWEWHTGWLGLGLSLAGAFFVTSGLKDIVGKPRPDFIARCQPDLSAISDHLAGGTGLKLEGAPVLVYTSICQNKDASVTQNGFAAFPSGHSSFAWAGLLYLSLWFATKFAVRYPVESPPFAHPQSGNPAYRSTLRPSAPPVWLLVIAASPVGAALYICATRYADYMHAGWDILGGSSIGIIFAWLGFRWYHGTCSISAHREDYGGWAFPPRSSSRAFLAAYGSSGYSTRGIRDPNGYEDLELGAMGQGGNIR